jgi:biotin carboxylase
MTLGVDLRPERRRARTPRPTLAVAYDVTSSSPLDLVEAVGGRCEVVWVVEASDPGLGPWARLLPRLGRVVDVAGRSAEEVAVDLATAGVDGVVAFTDSQLLRAARLGEELGLEGNRPEVVLALTDKVVQRGSFALAGLPGPQFAQILGCTTIDRARRLVEGLRFPVVIKPQRGSGSRDTFLAADLEEAEAYLSCVLVGNDGRDRDLIVEEWLDDTVPRPSQVFGDYVSVEAVARRGTVVPLAITGKFPLAFPCRETGNFLPHHLGPDRADEVVALAVRAAQVLGVTSGALHIEIKLTPEGPRLIEVNGRTGGGAIDALYAAVHGRSLTEIAAAAALGEEVEADTCGVDREDGRFVYAYFLQPPVEARVLTGVACLDRLTALEGVEATTVNRTVGDRLDWRDGSQGYLLSVRGSVDGLDELGQVPAQIRSALDLAWR